MTTTDDSNKEPEKNTVTISISEYNRLQAKDGQIQTLQERLTTLQQANESLSTEIETVKNSKTKTPSKEEIEKAVREELGSKIAAAEQAKADYEKKYKTAVVTDKVLNVLKSKNLSPWAIEYIRSTIEAECDLNNDQIVIKDEKGEERWSDKTPNQKMDVEEYAEAFKNKRPELFEATAKPGAPENGATNKQSSNQSRTSLTWQDVDRMEPSELKKLDPKLLDDLINQTPMR